MNRLACFLLLALTLAAPAAAQTIYGPANPAPASQLRPLTTDRPGKSSSPITVDPGWFQLEADIFNYSYTDENGATTRQWSAPNILLKYGLTNRMDLEVLVSGSNHYEYHNRATSQIVNANGLGDTWAGAKYNIFGDNSSDTPQNQTFAIIPFIKIPTAASGLGNHLVEATITLPYQFNLPNNWSLTVENSDGLRADHNGNRYEGDYQAMINLSHPLFLDNLTAQIEYFYDNNTDPAIGHPETFDAAVQWVVTPNVALDIGDYIGLNSEAPAENPYVGISARF